MLEDAADEYKGLISAIVQTGMDVAYTAKRLAEEIEAAQGRLKRLAEEVAWFRGGGAASCRERVWNDIGTLEEELDGQRKALKRLVFVAEKSNAIPTGWTVNADTLQVTGPDAS